MFTDDSKDYFFLHGNFLQTESRHLDSDRSFPEIVSFLPVKVEKGQRLEVPLAIVTDGDTRDVAVMFKRLLLLL